MITIKGLRKLLATSAGAALGATVLVWLWGIIDVPAVAQGTGPNGRAGHIRPHVPPQPLQIAQNTRGPANPSQPVRPVLEVYPCRAGEARVIGARLQQQFAQDPNVRIVVDERTSQILVRAPPQVHAQIATRLSQMRVEPTRPRAGSPGPAPAQPVRAREVQLQYVSAAQIESALTGILGDRLRSAPGVTSAIRSYRLALPGGRQIDLGIHHQTNLVTVQGAGAAVDSCVRLIQELDGPLPSADRSTRVISLRAANPASVRRAVDAIRTGGVLRGPPGSMLASLFQPQDEEPAAGTPAAVPAGPPPAANGAANGQPPAVAPDERGLIGPVQIEVLEGLDVIVIRGHKRDVDQVMQLIDEIERLSAETVPTVEVYHLRHVNCRALEELLTPLYEQVYLPRHGSVSITALVKPNALLLIGRAESVQAVVDLVKRLDRPVTPNTQFRVFRLRYAAAQIAQAAVAEFFAEEEEPVALQPRVLVTADFRSNSLIVRASPRDMAEVAKLIERLDTKDNAALNEIRLFHLQHTLAEDLAPVLQDALTGQAGAGAAGAAPGAAAGQALEPKSLMLRFVTVDAKGRRLLKSGILIDARVTADLRANALLVSAPAESMELIAALIDQLDQPPVAQAQIKVFTIVNGDALSLAETLQTLFGEQQGAAGEPAVRTAAAESESSLVQLRFAVDTRTNSIIASGSMGDLKVVEAILLRLDDADIRQRKTEVYRLKNAPAQDVADAINQFLSTEREVLQIEPGLLSPFEQLEREVVVVPEIVSNSLIVSATPRFFQEVKDLVEKLDERPPMVMIQVLIAEVALNDHDEFGIEVGLQDSLLFDRSLLEVLDRVTTTTTSQTPGGATTTTQSEEIVSANITPGYLFNNTQPLASAAGDQSLANSHVLGTQGLSNFGVGRGNAELGFGGLVLSASSEAVSVLVRALKEQRRLDVLSRPQIMTLDNQPAYIQVGQRVPYITGVNITETGQTNQVQFQEVGLILAVRPRISPDGMVVMEIDANKSEVGPESEGIAISILAQTGDVIRSPRINRTYAQTTVSALDGQTVILGGMLTKNKAVAHRKVPGLADIPVLGHLFRYDIEKETKTELLIIMTPHIVESEKDAEKVKQVEAARMHWCLSDVIAMHGDAGLRGRDDPWLDSETYVIYPDMDPTGEGTVVPNGETIRGPNGETIPGPGGVPNGNPFRPEVPPNSGGSPSPPVPEPLPSGGSMPAPLSPGGATPAASFRPPSGAGFLEPRPLPTGTEMRLRAGEQARWQPPGYPGGVQRAIYRRPGLPADQRYGGPAPVVPSMYHAPPQAQPPVAQPVQYRQPLTVQPPAQPPGGRPPQGPGPQVARLPAPYAPRYR